MPVTAKVLETTARLTFQTGVDAEGNPILKNRSYGDIKPEALDQDIFDVCSLIANLQQHSLRSVKKVVESELTSSS